MIAFLRWLRSIFASVLNSVAKLVALMLLVAVVLVVIGLARGDGLPANSLLTLDLRTAIADSASRPPIPLQARPVTMRLVVRAAPVTGSFTVIVLALPLNVTPLAPSPTVMTLPLPLTLMALPPLPTVT